MNSDERNKFVCAVAQLYVALILLFVFGALVAITIVQVLK